MAFTKHWVSHPWDPSSRSQESAIIALNLANDYGPKERQDEYYDWQYRRNPAGPAVIRLAVDERDSDKLAGIYVVIPIDLVCRGETVSAALSLNTLTDANYRRQRIFTELAQETYDLCAERGLHAVVGYPNPNSYPGFVKRLGFRDIGDIPLLLRALSPSRILEKKLPVAGLRRALGRVTSYGDRLFQVRSRSDAGVETLDEFDSGFDEFGDHLAGRFPLLVKRSAAFLNWRYLDHPFDYRVLVVRDAGLVSGFIAYRCVPFADMQCGMILDFAVRGSSAGSRAGLRLLRAALAEMTSRECDLVGALALPHTAENALLRRSGFLPCPAKLKPQPFPYIVRKNTTGFDFGLDVFDIQNWFVAIGDYDAA
ncbi:MAG: GNAT family N-acetyltransferase [Deltaproteobacteria bacterium]|nr:GNAT family N-acetyltransferase [Deltaproteobacteria bacterium]MBW2537432.1 GNAT family N-acetyltransferase [Deltaproteobacteria bacterium]